MKRRRILLVSGVAFAVILLGVGWLVARTIMRAGLEVEARISVAGREQRPATQAALYLLDEDMMKLALVKEGGMTPLEEKVFRENPELRTLAGLMNGRRREAYSLGPEVITFMEKSEPLWRPHVLQTGRTDAEGRARFEHLLPGDYWLMGRAETEGGGVAFWNLPVHVKRGENRLRLEPQNSLQCSSCR